MEPHNAMTATGQGFKPGAGQNSVADIVESIVRGAAESGLQPGQKLPPERRLADLLGVGRSQLREALKCLDVLGFISIRQGDGTYLSSSPANLLPRVISWGLLLDTAEARQLVEARGYLENVLVRMAAERSTDAERHAIGFQLSRMRYATSSAEFADADSQFHIAIAHAAHNAVLSSTLESTKLLLQAWIARVISYAENQATVIEQHEHILAAINAGDPEAAAAAMDQHIQVATKNLQSSLEEI